MKILSCNDYYVFVECDKCVGAGRGVHVDCQNCKGLGFAKIRIQEIKSADTPNPSVYS